MHAEVRNIRREGFTLAAVLVVMAAMLLMAVGVLAVVGIERKTARSYLDSKRAEWVARAGMEDVRGILREQSANDDYLIVAQPGEDTASGKEPLDLLYLARGKGGGDDVSYQLYPLYSAAKDTVTVEGFDSQFEDLDLVGDDPAELEVRERNDKANVAWIPVIDDENKEVGRYGFWVEDLQGKVSVVDTGRSAEAPNERVEWPFPAPGVREDPDLSVPELALHALDPVTTGDADASDIDDRLEDGMARMISPESVLAAMEFEAPLERDPVSGRLLDEEARSIEENVDAMVQPYEERPTVPFAKGISATASGKPKLNLNELLSGDREDSIDQWAEWVDDALPNFIDRKGGFPDDYVRTLAANLFDYADVDGEASAERGEYRGLDSYPLVSEYMIKHRWENFREIAGEKHFILTGTVYVELWNMSDQEAEGTVQISYDSDYVTDIDLVAGIELGSPDVLEDPTVVARVLEEDDGVYWLPEITLDPPLQPNEYRVINAGSVEYRYPSNFVPSPIELYHFSRGTTGYRMRWNGVEVDEARGKIVRRGMSLHYPTLSRPETKDRLRQRIEACVPAHSYSADPNAISDFVYVNNMGDPRMSLYLGESPDGTTPNRAMSPNRYGNYSPNRRTIRWSTIYNSDSREKAKVYGRVLPSEWPDGGHNSSFGSVPGGIRSNGPDGDQRIDPDNSQWFAGLSAPRKEEAPLRLSNRGLFYSACEMGRVYDPVMWDPIYDNTSDTRALQGGTMPGGQAYWPVVEVASAASPDYGGGNTLRIGRAEHPKFEVPKEGDTDLQGGQHAAHLLDLFHVGKPKSADTEERNGALIQIEGQINLNTASEAAVRAIVIGNLKQDPELARQVSKNHSTTSIMAPPTKGIELGAPARERAGDIIADAILDQRPFASAAEIGSIETEEGEKIFGNPAMYSEEDIQWTDSAAEELYARVYEASTLRSRNFRVWVVGQAIAPRDPGSAAEPVVLAESRKVFNLFADPGERDEDGEIDVKTYEPSVIHENDF